MPPVNINSISITRKSPASGKSKRVTLKSKGRITSAGESYDGQHANVTVSHGRKSKATKGNMYAGDSQPSSNFSISKRHAKHFPVGSHVNIHMTPVMPGASSDMDDMDDDAGDE